MILNDENQCCIFKFPFFFFHSQTNSFGWDGRFEYVLTFTPSINVKFYPSVIKINYIYHEQPNSIGFYCYAPGNMGVKNTKFNTKSRKKIQQPKHPNHPNKKEDFRFDGGRRFHNDENSKYFLPNDDDEVD